MTTKPSTLSKQEIRDLGQSMHNNIKFLQQKHSVEDPRTLFESTNPLPSTPLEAEQEPLAKNWADIITAVEEIRLGDLEAATEPMSNMYRDLLEAKRIILEENNLPNAPSPDHGIDLDSPDSTREHGFEHTYGLTEIYDSAFNDSPAAFYFIIAALLLIKDYQSDIATA